MMKEEDDAVLVVSSDSDEDETSIWKRKCKNKQFQHLWERIQPILFHYVLPESKSCYFPYGKFKELAEDLRKSLKLVYVESTQAFIWKNLIRWLASLKLCYEGISDLKYDERYNLILTDFMAQYVNYKCNLYSTITDETEVCRRVDEILLTLGVVFSGNITSILMTLLKIEVKDAHRLILDPIFRKYLSKKELHDPDDLISYLRLILCYRQWKKLTHLKEEKELINEIAVGTSEKSLKLRPQSANADLKAGILPKMVPPVDDDSRPFTTIAGLIGFAIRNKAYGTRILLINKSLDLEEAIVKYFQQYEKHIKQSDSVLCESTKALKIFNEDFWDSSGRATPEPQPLAVEDLKPPGNQLCGTVNRKDIKQGHEQQEQQIEKNIDKQGNANKHLSKDCDISSISNASNRSNLSSNSKQLSLSFKQKPQNRNSDVKLSVLNNKDIVIELDTTDDEDGDDVNNENNYKDNNSNDNADASGYRKNDEKSTDNVLVACEKQIDKTMLPFKAQESYIERLRRRAISLGNCSNNISRRNSLIVLSSSSDEDEDEVVSPVVPSTQAGSSNSLSRKPEVNSIPDSVPCRMDLSEERPSRKEKLHCITGEVSSTTLLDCSSAPDAESSATHNVQTLENAREVGTLSAVRTSPRCGSILAGTDFSDVSDDDTGPSSLVVGRHVSRKVNWSKFSKVVEEAISSTSEIPMRTGSEVLSENVIFSIHPRRSRSSTSSSPCPTRTTSPTDSCPKISPSSTIRTDSMRAISRSQQRVTSASRITVRRLNSLIGISDEGEAATCSRYAGIPPPAISCDNDSIEIEETRKNSEILTATSLESISDLANDDIEVATCSRYVIGAAPTKSSEDNATERSRKESQLFNKQLENLPSQNSATGANLESEGDSEVAPAHCAASTGLKSLLTHTKTLNVSSISDENAEISVTGSAACALKDIQNSPIVEKDCNSDLHKFLNDISIHIGDSQEEHIFQSSEGNCDSNKSKECTPHSISKSVKKDEPQNDTNSEIVVLNEPTVAIEELSIGELHGKSKDSLCGQSGSSKSAMKPCELQPETPKGSNERKLTLSNDKLKKLKDPDKLTNIESLEMNISNKGDLKRSEQQFEEEKLEDCKKIGKQDELVLSQEIHILKRKVNVKQVDLVVSQISTLESEESGKGNLNPDSKLRKSETSKDHVTNNLLSPEPKSDFLADSDTIVEKSSKSELEITESRNKVSLLQSCDNLSATETPNNSIEIYKNSGPIKTNLLANHHPLQFPDESRLLNESIETMKKHENNLDEELYDTELRMKTSNLTPTFEDSSMDTFEADLSIEDDLSNDIEIESPPYEPISPKIPVVKKDLDEKTSRKTESIVLQNNKETSILSKSPGGTDIYNRTTEDQINEKTIIGYSICKDQTSSCSNVSIEDEISINKNKLTTETESFGNLSSITQICSKPIIEELAPQEKETTTNDQKSETPDKETLEKESTNKRNVYNNELVDQVLEDKLCKDHSSITTQNNIDKTSEDQSLVEKQIIAEDSTRVENKITFEEDQCHHQFTCEDPRHAENVSAIEIEPRVTGKFPTQDECHIADQFAAITVNASQIDIFSCADRDMCDNTQIVSLTKVQALEHITPNDEMLPQTDENLCINEKRTEKSELLQSYNLETSTVSVSKDDHSMNNTSAVKDVLAVEHKFPEQLINSMPTTANTTVSKEVQTDMLGSVSKEGALKVSEEETVDEKSLEVENFVVKNRTEEKTIEIQTANNDVANERTVRQLEAEGSLSISICETKRSGSKDFQEQSIKLRLPENSADNATKFAATNNNNLADLPETSIKHKTTTTTPAELAVKNKEHFVPVADTLLEKSTLNVLTKSTATENMQIVPCSTENISQFSQNIIFENRSASELNQELSHEKSISNVPTESAVTEKYLETPLSIEEIHDDRFTTCTDPAAKPNNCVAVFPMREMIPYKSASIDFNADKATNIIKIFSKKSMFDESHKFTFIKNRFTVQYPSRFQDILQDKFKSGKLILLEVFLNSVATSWGILADPKAIQQLIKSKNLPFYACENYHKKQGMVQLTKVESFPNPDLTCDNLTSATAIQDQFSTSAFTSNVKASLCNQWPNEKEHTSILDLRKTDEDSNLSTQAEVATEDLGNPFLSFDSGDNSPAHQENGSETPQRDSPLVYYSNQNENYYPIEDQEVSTLTSKGSEILSYNTYHEDCGTPVLDEKDAEEIESPVTSKIVSLSILKELPKLPLVPVVPVVPPTILNNPEYQFANPIVPRSLPKSAGSLGVENRNNFFDSIASSQSNLQMQDNLKTNFNKPPVVVASTSKKDEILRIPTVSASGFIEPPPKDNLINEKEIPQVVVACTSKKDEILRIPEASASRFIEPPPKANLINEKEPNETLKVRVMRRLSMCNEFNLDPIELVKPKQISEIHYDKPVTERVQLQVPIPTYNVPLNLVMQSDRNSTEENTKKDIPQQTKSDKSPSVLDEEEQNISYQESWFKKRGITKTNSKTIIKELHSPTTNFNAKSEEIAPIQQEVLATSQQALVTNHSENTSVIGKNEGRRRKPVRVKKLTEQSEVINDDASAESHLLPLIEAAAASQSPIGELQVAIGCQPPICEQPQITYATHPSICQPQDALASQPPISQPQAATYQGDLTSQLPIETFTRLKEASMVETSYNPEDIKAATILSDMLKKSNKVDERLRIEPEKPIKTRKTSKQKTQKQAPTQFTRLTRSTSQLMEKLPFTDSSITPIKSTVKKDAKENKSITNKKRALSSSSESIWQHEKTQEILRSITITSESVRKVNESDEPKKDTTESLSLINAKKSFTDSNCSSDSDDAGKLVIDLSDKKASDSKQKTKSKTTRNCKRKANSGKVSLEKKVTEILQLANEKSEQKEEISPSVVKYDEGMLVAQNGVFKLTPEVDVYMAGVQRQESSKTMNNFDDITISPTKRVTDRKSSDDEVSRLYPIVQLIEDAQFTPKTRAKTGRRQTSARGRGRAVGRRVFENKKEDQPENVLTETKSIVKSRATTKSKQSAKTKTKLVSGVETSVVSRNKSPTVNTSPTINNSLTINTSPTINNSPTVKSADNVTAKTGDEPVTSPEPKARVRPRQRLSFSIDVILGNRTDSPELMVEDLPSGTEKEKPDLLTSPQITTNKEMWLTTLSLRKARKSLDEVVKELSDAKPKVNEMQNESTSNSFISSTGPPTPRSTSKQIRKMSSDAILLQDLKSSQLSTENVYPSRLRNQRKSLVTSKTKPSKARTESIQLKALNSEIDASTPVTSKTNTSGTTRTDLIQSKELSIDIDASRLVISETKSRAKRAESIQLRAENSEIDVLKIKEELKRMQPIRNRRKSLRTTVKIVNAEPTNNFDINEQVQDSKGTQIQKTEEKVEKFTENVQQVVPVSESLDISKLVVTKKTQSADAAAHSNKTVTETKPRPKETYTSETAEECTTPKQKTIIQKDSKCISTLHTVKISEETKQPLEETLELRQAKKTVPPKEKKSAHDASANAETVEQIEETQKQLKETSDFKVTSKIEVRTQRKSVDITLKCIDTAKSVETVKIPQETGDDQTTKIAASKASKLSNDVLKCTDEVTHKHQEILEEEKVKVSAKDDVECIDSAHITDTVLESKKTIKPTELKLKISVKDALKCANISGNAETGKILGETRNLLKETELKATKMPIGIRLKISVKDALKFTTAEETEKSVTISEETKKTRQQIKKTSEAAENSKTVTSTGKNLKPQKEAQDSEMHVDLPSIKPVTAKELVECELSANTPVDNQQQVNVTSAKDNKTSKTRQKTSELVLGPKSSEIIEKRNRKSTDVRNNLHEVETPTKTDSKPSEIVVSPKPIDIAAKRRRKSIDVRKNLNKKEIETNNETQIEESTLEKEETPAVKRTKLIMQVRDITSLMPADLNLNKKEAGLGVAVEAIQSKKSRSVGKSLQDIKTSRVPVERPGPKSRKKSKETIKREMLVFSQETEPDTEVAMETIQSPNSTYLSKSSRNIKKSRFPSERPGPKSRKTTQKTIKRKRLVVLLKKINCTWISKQLDNDLSSPESSSESSRVHEIRRETRLLKLKSSLTKLSSKRKRVSLDCSRSLSNSPISLRTRSRSIEASKSLRLETPQQTKQTTTNLINSEETAIQIHENEEASIQPVESVTIKIETIPRDEVQKQLELSIKNILGNQLSETDDDNSSVRMSKILLTNQPQGFDSVPDDIFAGNGDTSDNIETKFYPTILKPEDLMPKSTPTEDGHQIDDTDTDVKNVKLVENNDIADESKEEQFPSKKSNSENENDESENLVNLTNANNSEGNSAPELELDPFAMPNIVDINANSSIFEENYIPDVIVRSDCLTDAIDAVMDEIPFQSSDCMISGNYANKYYNEEPLYWLEPPLLYIEQDAEAMPTVSPFDILRKIPKGNVVPESFTSPKGEVSPDVEIDFENELLSYSSLVSIQSRRNSYSANKNKKNRGTCTTSTPVKIDNEIDKDVVPNSDEINTKQSDDSVFKKPNSVQSSSENSTNDVAQQTALNYYVPTVEISTEVGFESYDELLAGNNHYFSSSNMQKSRKRSRSCSENEADLEEETISPPIAVNTSDSVVNVDSEIKVSESQPNEKSSSAEIGTNLEKSCEAIKPTPVLTVTDIIAENKTTESNTIKIQDKDIAKSFPDGKKADKSKWNTVKVQLATNSKEEQISSPKKLKNHAKPFWRKQSNKSKSPIQGSSQDIVKPKLDTPRSNIEINLEESEIARRTETKLKTALNSSDSNLKSVSETVKENAVLSTEDTVLQENRSLPLILDSIEEPKQVKVILTKLPELGETADKKHQLETDISSCEPTKKKARIHAVSQLSTDDLFDRLKRESPVNPLMQKSKPVLKKAASFDTDDNSSRDSASGLLTVPTSPNAMVTNVVSPSCESPTPLSTSPTPLSTTPTPLSTSSTPLSISPIPASISPIIVPSMPLITTPPRVESSHKISDPEPIDEPMDNTPHPFIENENTLPVTVTLMSSIPPSISGVPFDTSSHSYTSVKRQRLNNDVQIVQDVPTKFLTGKLSPSRSPSHLTAHSTNLLNSPSLNLKLNSTIKPSTVSSDPEIVSSKTEVKSSTSRVTFSPLVTNIPDVNPLMAKPISNTRSPSQTHKPIKSILISPSKSLSLRSDDNLNSLSQKPVKSLPTPLKSSSSVSETESSSESKKQLKPVPPKSEIGSPSQSRKPGKNTVALIESSSSITGIDSPSQNKKPCKPVPIPIKSASSVSEIDSSQSKKPGNNIPLPLTSSLRESEIGSPFQSKKPEKPIPAPLKSSSSVLDSDSLSHGKKVIKPIPISLKISLPGSEIVTLTQGKELEKAIPTPVKSSSLESEIVSLSQSKNLVKPIPIPLISSSTLPKLDSPSQSKKPEKPIALPLKSSSTVSDIYSPSQNKKPGKSIPIPMKTTSSMSDINSPSQCKKSGKSAPPPFKSTSSVSGINSPSQSKNSVKPIQILHKSLSEIDSISLSKKSIKHMPIPLKSASSLSDVGSPSQSQKIGKPFQTSHKPSSSRPVMGSPSLSRKPVKPIISSPAIILAHNTPTSTFRRAPFTPTAAYSSRSSSSAGHGIIIASLTAEIDSLSEDLKKLPEVDGTYAQHKNRKRLLELHEQKLKQLEEIKRKHNDELKFNSGLSSKSRSYSERQPSDNHSSYRPAVHSSQRESKDKERRRGYVNKFAVLKNKTFEITNKIEDRASTGGQSKTLPSWDPKPASTEEIIADLTSWRNK